MSSAGPVWLLSGDPYGFCAGYVEFLKTYRESQAGVKGWTAGPAQEATDDYKTNPVVFDWFAQVVPSSLRLEIDRLKEQISRLETLNNRLEAQVTQLTGVQTVAVSPTPPPVSVLLTSNT